jgi:hypothetical protein
MQQLPGVSRLAVPTVDEWQTQLHFWAMCLQEPVLQDHPRRGQHPMLLQA